MFYGELYKFMPPEGSVLVVFLTVMCKNFHKHISIICLFQKNNDFFKIYTNQVSYLIYHLRKQIKSDGFLTNCTNIIFRLHRVCVVSEV